MGNVIDPSFYRRDVLRVARELLGMELVSSHSGRRSIITEVEAYDGPEDKACHAHRGRTKRTEVMFAEGGVWYVYLVYGMHWMLNIVTGDRDYPSAVLIRSVSGVTGPGRVTRAFEVDGTCNGRMAGPKSGLWIEEGRAAVPAGEIVRTPRIGIDYAEEWREKPYRFVWTNAPVIG